MIRQDRTAVVLFAAFAVAAAIAPGAARAHHLVGEAPLPLSQRMLVRGDLTGFTPLTPTYDSDPGKWAHACAGGATRVRAEGLVASAGEHLASLLTGRDAVSLVARFRTARGAQDDVRTFVKRHADCSSTAITVRAVAGIAGARSIDAHQSDGEGFDVVFADGAFSYDVGAFTVDRNGPPTLAEVIAAARRLYQRVHGRAAVVLRSAQTVVVEADYSNAVNTGPPTDHVGHLQLGNGSLRDIGGKTIGTFATRCRWIEILSHGDDANEHCTATATTSDGHLSFAGPSLRSAPTHTWSLVSGTGSYAGARGTVTVRDITPTETVAEMTIVPRAQVSLAAGVVEQPAVDAPFRVRADAACRVTQTKLSHLPGFSFGNFDPFHPDKSSLPKIGRFFAGPGDARPALRTLERQLAALGAPPAAEALWSRVLASRRADLAVRDAQIRAALKADVPAFVGSVHASGRSGVALALLATAFGVDSCAM